MACFDVNNIAGTCHGLCYAFVQSVLWTRSQNMHTITERRFGFFFFNIEHPKVLSRFYFVIKSF